MFSHTNTRSKRARILNPALLHRLPGTATLQLLQHLHPRLHNNNAPTDRHRFNSIHISRVPMSTTMNAWFRLKWMGKQTNYGLSGTVCHEVKSSSQVKFCCKMYPYITYIRTYVRAVSSVRPSGPSVRPSVPSVSSVRQFRPSVPSVERKLCCVVLWSLVVVMNE